MVHDGDCRPHRAVDEPAEGQKNTTYGPLDMRTDEQRTEGRAKMPDLTPESGNLHRAAFRPFEWRIPVRIRATCSTCNRDVIHWRSIGIDQTTKVRCNGEHKQSCKDETQRLRPARGSGQSNTSKKSLKAVADLAAANEVARLLRCPRPDHAAWGTLEGAEDVVRVMRAKQAPRSRNLVGYLCECGGYHVGTRLISDPIVQRWGTA